MANQTPVPPGMAVCDECPWTAKGPTRFSDAVDHRKATGHLPAASLRDAPGDDTGQRVTQALHAARQALR